jgi:uncharacterized lipoprotein YehR (DUF1307 family)
MTPVARACSMVGLILAIGIPSAALAQSAPASPAAATHAAAMKPPTKDQVETALKATKPSFKQMRAMKPMLDQYKTAAANAPNADAKQAAAKQLMSGMKTVLTAAQQATFKQSLMSQMKAAQP